MNCFACVLRLPRWSRARGLVATIMLLMSCPSGVLATADSSTQTPPTPTQEEGLQIEVNKKGLGKEVVIHKGAREWYMLVEVAEGNTVVIRQEKEGVTYIVDESETHDRALSKGEIDAVIEDFINSVKTRTKDKK